MLGTDIPTSVKNFLMVLQILLFAPLWHKDSQSVLRFDIGPREVGEKIGKHTNRQIYLDFNIDLVYLQLRKTEILPSTRDPKRHLGQRGFQRVVAKNVVMTKHVG